MKKSDPTFCCIWSLMLYQLGRRFLLSRESHCGLGRVLSSGGPSLRLHLSRTQTWVGIPAVVQAGCVTEGSLPYLMELSSLYMWIRLPSRVVWKSEQGMMVACVVHSRRQVPPAWLLTPGILEKALDTRWSDCSAG